MTTVASHFPLAHLAYKTVMSTQQYLLLFIFFNFFILKYLKLNFKIKKTSSMSVGESRKNISNTLFNHGSKIPITTAIC